MPFLQKSFQKIEKNGTLGNSLYKVSTIPAPEENKGNPTTVTLRNIDTNVFKQIQANLIQ